MCTAIFNTQEFLRDINEDESKRLELLKDVIKEDGVSIGLDMTDIEKVLSCDGQMVIIKAEADNIETALNNLFANSPIEKETVSMAKRLLLSISIKCDENFLWEEMDYLRGFINSFKECSFNTWGLYKNANQTHNVSLICWAVGI